MKNLELEKYDVQELHAAEMEMTYGGNPFLKILEKAAEYVLTEFIVDVIKHPGKLASPNLGRTPYGHMGGAQP